MARANRYIVAGQIYHVTHRCHNRQFLLRFQRDRDAYRHWLFKGIQRHPVSVLCHMITSNHVHLLLRSETIEAISDLMHLVEGAVAQQFNRRTHRDSAFWGDRYHATMVDTGEYVLNCLRYIDLNMLRAQVVDNPLDWKWSSFAELVTRRERYRIVDRDSLLESVGYADFDRWLADHVDSLQATASNGLSKRDPKWTESLAVGSREYVVAMAPVFRHRLRLEIESDTQDKNTWVVRETRET